MELPTFPVDSDGDDNETEPLDDGWIQPTAHHPREEDRGPLPVPSYTEADLYPTTNPDPECDPHWPLAFYWPVYVSNFRLESLKEDARNAQIARFFAAKGLLARMIFIREPEGCSYYQGFQRVSWLLDMLVYFTSKEDAECAIRLCHRTTYYGHRLNVWPGRRPEFFDGTRTVEFYVMKAHCAEKSETAIELILRGAVGPCVETVARFNLTDVVVEFSDEEAMRKAISQSKWTAKKLTEPIRKQRFLEQDVRGELLAMITFNPEFLDMVPPKKVLRMLLKGQIPTGDRSWQNVPQPKALPDATAKKTNKRKGERNKSLKKSLKRKIDRQEGGSQAKKQASEEVPIRYVMLVKRQQYCDLRQRLLEALKRSPTNQLRDDTIEMFYQMLTLEEELMDLLPDAMEYFDCLRLEVGLTKAVLVADEFLPFPELPAKETLEQAYEDVPPSGGSRAIPEFVPAVRYYSDVDLNPSLTDPNCGDQNWPLANFWPVYVDNFRINTFEVERRNDQIREYFAAKGLLATYVFVHDSPSHHYYLWYQKRVMLVDILVYFTSREDAQKAIKLCHRDSYYGHYLNVFPGREPVFFDLERSGFAQLNNIPEGKISHHPSFLLLSTTEFEENGLEVLPEDVTCVTRPETNLIQFELTRPDHLQSVLRRLATEVNPNSGPLKEPSQKQRFLEADAKDQLTAQLQSDPFFLRRQRPKLEVLHALYWGTVPARLLNWNWFGWNEPRELGLHWKLCETVRDVCERIQEVLRIWCQLQEEFGMRLR